MRFFTLNKKKIIDGVFLLIVVLAVIPILIPFLHKGFFPTHDDVQVQRIFEMSQALRYGSFPPRWASGLLYGHGYPLFSFYSPLTYYLGALLVFAGANFLMATKIVFLGTFFLGAIAMYLLVKDMFGRLSGLVASVIFSYAPYKAVDVYVRGNLPEFLSLSLFPLVVWTNWWLLKGKSKAWLPFFSLSLALLILTHNISFVIFAGFLTAFNLVVTLGLKEKKQLFTKVFCGGFLALMISSFFWLPLSAETKLVNLINQPWPFSYDRFFLTFKQLWSTPWGFNGFTEPQPMSLQLGKTFIVFSILAFLLGLFRKYDFHKKIWLLFSGILFFSVFMTTFSSNFIWKALPFLSFFQFPWRFHILITFCSSVLIAMIVYYVSQIVAQKKLPKIIVGVAALIIIFLVMFENYRFFRPKVYLIPETGGVTSAAGQAVSNFFERTGDCNWELIYKEKYSGWNETDAKIDYRNKGGNCEVRTAMAATETTTWDDEYLPLWVKVKPKDYEGEKVKIVEGEGEIKDINWGYSEKDFTFLAKKESVVGLAHIYYPGWKAFINGKQQTIDYSNERGLMRIKLSEGQNLVKFKFLRTPLRLTAEIISLIGLITVVFLLFQSFGKSQKPSSAKNKNSL